MIDADKDEPRFPCRIAMRDAILMFLRNFLRTILKIIFALLEFATLTFSHVWNLFIVSHRFVRVVFCTRD